MKIEYYERLDFLPVSRTYVAEAAAWEPIESRDYSHMTNQPMTLNLERLITRKVE